MDTGYLERFGKVKEFDKKIWAVDVTGGIHWSVPLKVI